LDNYKPKYLKLYKSGELLKRAKTAIKLLKNCRICPQNCRVDRAKGEKGVCRAGRELVVSGVSPHYGEEKVLVGKGGSGTIFFSWCNLSCVFCQNCDTSQEGNGYTISEEKLGEAMVRLQNLGVENINLVSPSHYWPQILKAIYYAANKGLKIPIVYNTGCYDTTTALRFMEDVVDIYMPDIKFSDDETARKYAGAPRYFSVAKKAVKEMHRQVGDLKLDSRGIAYRGLLIRHLVLPEDLSGTEEVLDFIAEEVSKNTYINIMDQYYPAHKAYNIPPLNRRITKKEFRKAIVMAQKKGLHRLEKPYRYHKFL